MTDDKEKLQMNTKKLSLGNKPLGSGGFSPSRGKTVTVEVRKNRTIAKPGQPQEIKASEQSAIFTQGEADSGSLTKNERDGRLQALQRAATEKRDKPAGRGFDAVKFAPVEQSKSPDVLERKSPARADAKPQKPGTKFNAPKTEAVEEVRDIKKVRFEEAEDKTDRADDLGRSRKITITNFEEEEKVRVRSIASMRRAREKHRRKEFSKMQPKEAEKVVREVVIPEIISVQELANRMAVRGVDVVKSLMKLGVMATVNQTVDADTAELIVTEYGHKFRRVAESDVENILKDIITEVEEKQDTRPPVVTVMGHVDHGKTSLLDALRKTDVAAHEAGGITQHIGAYQITIPSGEKVTFIDTPGHAAFTSMRARGAKVTDVVILVVAADDGVMPQTVEAINHAKAANVPIIVAVNKIDKPGATPNKVRDELLQHNLVPEELGGDVQIVHVSAKTKQGLDKLLEAVLLQAEVLDLKAAVDRSAIGTVIEAQIDKGRGVTTTFLVQKGTIKIGDNVVAGISSGRVRALIDDKGVNVQSAGPATPVVVLGLDQLPNAGDEFNVVDNDKQAREITEYRLKKVRDLRSLAEQKTMDQLFHSNAQGLKELNIIVKSDVQGSAEAIIGSVSKLSNEEINVKIIHSAAGSINESDISLAKALNSMVIGFNVRANAQAKEQAAKEHIDIRYYSIIYELIDDLKKIMGGMMSPIKREKFIGYAEIREVFNITKAGKIAGSYVKEGIVKRGAGVRLLRENVVIHEGKLKTLKRFKDDVKEVKEGMECGIAFENYEDIKPGDMVEAFEVTEELRVLE